MQEKKLPLAAVVAGPTASGKTALSVALAKRLCGEVVSADSMQIYQDMDIGTAKPTREEMQGIRHHLLGFLPSDKEYSVAQFVPDAKQAVNEIVSNKKLPIICGGTGLYISSFIHNLSFVDSGKDDKIRSSLEREYQSNGIVALLEELKAFDPETAAELSQTGNVKRIIRAIELYRVSGITISEQKKRSRQQPSPYCFACILLNFRDRSKLYERINKRVDNMLAQGLEEEAKTVLSKAGKTSAQAIGHKELAPYFRGECSYEEAVEKLKRETRRYSKRQITWFKREESFFSFYVDDYRCIDELADDVEKYILQFL